MLSGVGTLDFITDYFPQLNELFIDVEFDHSYQIDKTYDHRFNTWKMRFSISRTALKLKFFEPSISLLRQRGVDVFVQPKAKSDFQIETFSRFSSFM